MATKTTTRPVTNTVKRSFCSVLPGLHAHQPLQLSPLMFCHFMYETESPNKTVAGLKPWTELRIAFFFWFQKHQALGSSPQLICTNDSASLLAAAALWSSRRLSSVPGFFLLNSSHLYQPTSGHFAVLLQRSWCCTSNRVRIKLLTRVWQVGEAMPLKCKADISGSNNDGVFPLCCKWMLVWILSGIKFQTCSSRNSRVLVLRPGRPEVQHPFEVHSQLPQIKTAVFSINFQK